MKIVWHGHACFEVGGTLTVVMDPHDGKSLGIDTPSAKADVVLVSHDHFDHNCSRVIRGDFPVLKDPGKKELKGLKVIGIPVFHDDQEGAKRGRVTMFLFELDGVRFCHCGDLGHQLNGEQIEAIGDVDVLFVPVGGVFTLDGAQARSLVRSLRPKVAVPMHFRIGGLSLSIQTVDGFLEGIPERKILRVGNEVEFEKNDLPRETEYWVFSP
ncbi:MAG TPA: MBL fold metallo-hydrolase [Methanomassiliicoccales archaeon]|nr:MBL fold metallo-hydrolase [Methanomassiliicoccales archaeon]